MDSGSKTMQGPFLKLRTILDTVLLSEHGQDLVEYALTVGMIAFGTVAGMQSIAGGVDTVFSTVATVITTAV
jgi:Flp pilus assembly pilin Flp